MKIQHYKHTFDFNLLLEYPTLEELRVGLRERHRHLINRAMIHEAEKRGVIHIGPKQ